jgi:hypothetical protein
MHNPIPSNPSILSQDDHPPSPQTPIKAEDLKILTAAARSLPSRSLSQECTSGLPCVSLLLLPSFLCLPLNYFLDGTKNLLVPGPCDSVMK